MLSIPHRTQSQKPLAASLQQNQFRMIKIYATRKSEEIFGQLEKDDLIEEVCEKWNCHVFILERKRHFLLVHKETLYGIVVNNITKKELKNLHNLLLSELEERLIQDYGDAEGVKDYISENYKVLKIFSTDNDQRTLGTLKDQIYHIKAYCEDKTEKLNSAKTYCQNYLNDMPIGVRNFNSPSELMGMKLNLKPRTRRI